MDGLSAIDQVPDAPPARFARGTQPRSMVAEAAAAAARAADAVPDGEAFGPYVVHERLGAGGMATVHRAEQRGIAGFSKPVALKRMFANLAKEPSFLKSFVHEAQLASRLRHDHIAQAYDFGKVGDTYYIAMELVPGPTLQQLMNRARTTGVAIPVPIILEILIQLCDALDHAHNLCDDAGVPLGIIHRDVSPSNVILSDAGIVKLIDFGIAKATSSSQRTSAGVIKGKFGYIAPEYTRGQLDARADLFALGVIAHELLTGKRLFRGESDFATLVEVRERQIERPSRHNAGVSSDLDDIVMTALQREPTMRWQTAGAMRNALATAARGQGVAVGGQRLRDWIGGGATIEPTGESHIETLEASLEVSEPSVIIELQSVAERRASEPTVSLRPSSAAAEPFSTPETFRVRDGARRKRSRFVALVAFAAVGIAAWQAWSALVVWSAGG
jgi:serine/threonine protein kinase